MACTLLNVAPWKPGKRKREKDKASGLSAMVAVTAAFKAFWFFHSTATTALRLYEPNRGRVFAWPPGSFRPSAFLVERNGAERWPFLFCLSARRHFLAHSGGVACCGRSLQHLSRPGFVAAVVVGFCVWAFHKLSELEPISNPRRILLALFPIFGTWSWCNLGFAGAWQIALGFAMLGETAAL